MILKIDNVCSKDVQINEMKFKMKNQWNRFLNYLESFNVFNAKFRHNIMEGDTHTEEISYIHAHSIDSKKFVPSPFTESDVEDEDDKSAALLKMTREDWCSNQSRYEMDLCNTVE